MAPLARRGLLASVALAAATRPGAAQPSRRIALAHSGVPTNQLDESARSVLWLRAFFVTLRKLGYDEGRNLIIERYSAEGRPERFASLAQQVVESRPEVIVANLVDFVGVLTRTTTSVPIVGIVGDPVGSGLIKSLARPGGNLTGVSTVTGVEVATKGLQVLRDAVPSARKIGFLASRTESNEAIEQTLSAAARKLGTTLSGIYVADVNEAQLRFAFANAEQQRFDAIMVGYEGTLLAHRALIVELAARHRLPALYPYRDYVELGGLLAYTPDVDELGQRMAEAVGRILGGTKPSDIPFWQPTRIQQIVNLKAARALNLALSPTMLGGADEVVD
jgi:putative ABC transport system substrate-binding protein